MEAIGLGIFFFFFWIMDKICIKMETYGIKFDLEEEPKKKAPAPQSQPSAQQLRGSNQWQ